MECFALRGASGYEPEDAIHSVERAIGQGADWISIDARFTGRELVTFHSDGGVPVSLEKIAAWIERRANLHIELRDSHSLQEVVEWVRHCIFDLGWSYGDFLVSSYDCEDLERLRELDHHIARGLSQISVPVDASNMLARSRPAKIFVYLDSIRKEYVDDMHRAGVEVVAFPINSEHDFATVAACGVDGVISAFPDMVVACRYQDTGECDESRVQI